MRNYLEIALLIAGWALVVLCIASLWIPKVLDWKEKIKPLSPLMKELWWTYALYVWCSHIFFSVLALGFSDFLLSQTGAAVAISFFIFGWWGVRLYLQFFGFNLDEVKNTFMHRLAKHLLTLLFVYLVAVFGSIVLWNADFLE